MGILLHRNRYVLFLNTYYVDEIKSQFRTPHFVVMFPTFNKDSLNRVLT